MEDTFAPEFINRIDDIVVFNTLSLDDVKRIVDIEFGRIAKRAAAMGYTLELSEDAREELAALGFQPRYGARSLRRMLLEYVEEPLAGMIVGEEVCGGDTVSVEFVGGHVALVRPGTGGSSPHSIGESIGCALRTGWNDFRHSDRAGTGGLRAVPGRVLRWFVTCREERRKSPWASA